MGYPDTSDNDRWISYINGLKFYVRNNVILDIEINCKMEINTIVTNEWVRADFPGETLNYGS